MPGDDNSILTTTTTHLQAIFTPLLARLFPSLTTSFPIVRRTNSNTLVYTVAAATACLIYIFGPAALRLITSVTSFIFSPFITSSSTMRWPRAKKREGKHTVGLVNRANDCFANSNLQALGALPSLYTYLVELLDVPRPPPEAYRLLVSRTLTDATETASRRSAGANMTEPVEITGALRRMVAALNEPVLEHKELDPWDFLHSVERFYNSLISRAQHDAHELLLLVLETLETEQLRLTRYYSALRAQTKDKEEQEKLDKVIASIPKFPFKGSTRDQITCSRCGYVPTTAPSPFAVLSLMVPQRARATLPDLLVDFAAPEYIQDYGCARCRVGALIQRSQVSGDEALVAALKPYSEDPSHLPEELEARLPRDVTSAIAKSTQFHRLPQVLAIHLSRSIYGGFGASRNSCKVSVPERLELYEDYTAEEDKLRAMMGAQRRVEYELAAMIRHKGTHYAGHYECFRRKNLTWWRSHLESQQDRGQDAATRRENGSMEDLKNKNKTDDSGDINELDRLPYPQQRSAQVSPAVVTAKTHTHDATPSAPSSSQPATPLSAEASDSGRSPVSSSSSSSSWLFSFLGGPSPASGQSPSPSPPLSSSASLPSDGAVTITGEDGEYEVLPASPQHGWWQVSDDKVWERSVREVLREESGAYLLFYERVESNNNSSSSSNGNCSSNGVGKRRKR
ncbi:uncharacterized protein SAPINGB_P005491 [Magnusiomyces paraingens]|uniref:Ubiquitin carboxyl-terminal hydrolase n=1 Tax=Magnusiomyces paraingens TaxID=2606893 RepID=A0A5E8BZY7_9ASCO|nr:uncharacterized protein SAPINGB_P005491 [Saprochaete ingens]VVT57014.1 unnamed protein product [Saprochaete ingens]